MARAAVEALAAIAAEVSCSRKEGGGGGRDAPARPPDAAPRSSPDCCCAMHPAGPHPADVEAAQQRAPASYAAEGMAAVPIASLAWPAEQQQQQQPPPHEQSWPPPSGPAPPLAVRPLAVQVPLPPSLGPMSQPSAPPRSQLGSSIASAPLSSCPLPTGTPASVAAATSIVTCSDQHEAAMANSSASGTSSPLCSPLSPPATTPPPSPRAQPQYHAPDSVDAAAAIAAQPRPRPRASRLRPPKPQQDALVGPAAPPVAEVLTPVSRAAAPSSDVRGPHPAVILDHHHRQPRSRSLGKGDRTTSSTKRPKSGAPGAAASQPHQLKPARAIRRASKDAARPSLAKPTAAANKCADSLRGRNRHSADSDRSGGSAPGPAPALKRGALTASTQLSHNAKEYQPPKEFPPPKPTQRRLHSPSDTSWDQAVMRWVSRHA